jgi:hypothetical protein
VVASPHRGCEPPQTGMPPPPLRPVVRQVIPVEADMSDFQREIDILRKCASPYVVSYRGSFLKVPPQGWDGGGVRWLRERAF